MKRLSARANLVLFDAALVFSYVFFELSPAGRSAAFPMGVAVAVVVCVLANAIVYRRNHG